MSTLLAGKETGSIHDARGVGGSWVEGNVVEKNELSEEDVDGVVDGLCDKMYGGIKGSFENCRQE